MSLTAPKKRVRRLKKAEKSNRSVVYMGEGIVAVLDTYCAELRNDDPGNMQECPHGVILEVVIGNICGSDLHMVNGRTIAEPGLELGHEILGRVIAVGPHVRRVKVGDFVMVPFNIACGFCQYCRAGLTNLCETSNPNGFGSAYGYAALGGWRGGQAKEVMVPWADTNCFVLPDDPRVEELIEQIAMLMDIGPTGLWGVLCATKHDPYGKGIIIFGAGPVGLAAAEGARFVGCAPIIVADLNPQRLKRAAANGFLTIDVSRTDATVQEQLQQLTGDRFIDAVVDCVGMEQRGCGTESKIEVPAAVLNACISVVRPGGTIAAPGLYVPNDPGAKDAGAAKGRLGMNFGELWAKAGGITTGQTPVLKLMGRLLQGILYGDYRPATAVGAMRISLENAPEAYKAFQDPALGGGGVSTKWMLDPKMPKAEKLPDIIVA